MRESVFGDQDIPIPKPPPPPPNRIIKEDFDLFYQEGKPTPLMIGLRSLLICIPIFLVGFLVYQCSEVVDRDMRTKYKKVAAQHNIEVSENTSSKPRIDAVYKISSATTGDIEVQAKRYYSKTQSNGKLHIEFFNDSCGCDAFAQYTNVDSIIKIKDGYP